MLKKLFLAGAFFMVCNGSYGQSAAVATTTATGPKFSLTNNDSVFNFCEIEEEDVVRHQFLFRNTGTGPLFINDISSDVRNAEFRWPSRIIKPGKTGVITVTYRSFMDEGTVAGDIYISSNATEKPVAALHIKGKITCGGCCEDCEGKAASK